MDYKFLNSSVDIENVVLPESGSIHPILFKNNYAEVIKALDFINSDEKTLHVHGFLGTGKRQFINFVSEFIQKDVIKLEYYCKTSTVCDDILLNFIQLIEANPMAKAVNLTSKISTLVVKLKQYLSSIKKPFLVILHSFDDIQAENKNLVLNCINDFIGLPNVKLIISTKAMEPNLLVENKLDRKIFLKALSKKNFEEFLILNKLNVSETTIEDFYKYTRGYYYYTALTVKIVQAMRISLNDFLQKFVASGMSFDAFIGLNYTNLIPATIRNFFWFLRTIRHGISVNALAIFELYDDFSIEYLKSNLMIFQVDEMLYVQDYFQINVEISIPQKTEIKLHKYIINIYEKQLKEPLHTRAVLLSRQALRAEIEYHNECIKNLENGEKVVITEVNLSQKLEEVNEESRGGNYTPENSDEDIFKHARQLIVEKKYTDAIEAFQKIIDSEKIDLQILVEARLELARLYKKIEDYQKSEHYYSLVEIYYKQHNEIINLNYLYYETTDLYVATYKINRAIETIRKVIYSVDTPKTLMVDACILLANIFSSENNNDEAFSYYKKALESLDEETNDETRAELYFKYALVNDEKDDEALAFEYYTKCIALNYNNAYKALAYSNMASCYYENENYSEAKDCFIKAYKLEKEANNYEGIYYSASYLAKIFIKEKSKKALSLLKEAKQCAEFINEDFCILEAAIALGDYYYNSVALNKDALIEYFKARRIAQTLESTVDISMIERRIDDMKLRMDKEVFKEIENKYG